MLGKDHPDTLKSMNNLAESLRQQSKYAEAETIYQRAEVKSHPQDRLDTAARKNKRKAEHEDDLGLRRSTRIMEGHADA